MRWSRNAEVALQFGEDVLERRGRPHARGNAEGKAVRLSGAVVGILPDDHHAHLVERCSLEGMKDVTAFGEHAVLLPFRHQERLQISEIGTFELSRQMG